MGRYLMRFSGAPVENQERKHLVRVGHPVSIANPRRMEDFEVAREWAEANARGKFANATEASHGRMTFYFSSASDATLFKLRFGRDDGTTQ